jgi:glycosyltransferase involved in cell wall biosynthesis
MADHSASPQHPNVGTLSIPRNGALNVLHLIAPTHFGGAEQVVLNLAGSIDRSRFNITVGAFINVHFPKNEFLARLEEEHIPYRIFWLRRTVDVDNIARLVKLIRTRDIDIIHTHGYRSDIIGLLAARISSRPIIATIHGFVPINSKLRFYEQVDLIALRFFDRILPVSDHIREVLRKSGISQKRITTVRNAIAAKDAAEPGPKISRSRLSFLKPAGDFLIGIVGRLSPEKNIPGFLDVARRLAGKYDHLRFVVVGDGPERDCLEGLATRLKLDGKVRFTGFVEEMEGIYALLDMLVISSSTEGIPLTVLEAMHHGIPVVSTRVGGIPEIIESGVNGLIVEAGDMKALSNAVESLIVDSRKYMAISLNARERVRRDFNRLSWTRKIQECYTSVIDQKRVSIHG